MTYSSIMIAMELGESNAQLLRVGSQLAAQFQSGVVGIGVSQPLQIVVSGSYVSSEAITQDMREIDDSLKLAEEQFRQGFSGYAKKVEWRSAIVSTTTSDYIAMEARCANLILTGVQTKPRLYTHQSFNKGDLVIKAGRPVLIVPDVTENFTFERIVIAWKDTREARRAVLDALPLLEKATHVTVVELAAEADMVEANRRLNDVAHWLQRQRIHAEPMASHAHEGDTQWLETVAASQNADLIVAGAYGHSRLREWVFGGFTKTLLHPVHRCSFLSH
jgi:nucleotide-binding universal stress UspA family protein